MIRKRPLLVALSAFFVGLLNFDFGPQPETGRMAAVALFMAILWLTEALPLSITALFPLLGIMPAKAVSTRYVNEIVFLLIGAFLLAQAIEKCRLHHRLAFLALTAAGDRLPCLFLGFLFLTAFLSMWIANTAATSVMLPMALAVLTRFEVGLSRKEHHRAQAALLLLIAYSASIGGMLTPVGTPPNLVLNRLYLETTGREINFLSWVLLTLPIGLVMLLALVGWFYFRWLRKLPPLTGLLQQHTLPKMSLEERWVATVFVLTALLWLTRKGLTIGGETLFSGWQSWLPYGRYLHDSSVAMVAALLLFTVPIRGRPVLDDRALKELPWGTILLFGGSFALAAGFKASGLTEAIVAAASTLDFLDTPLLITATVIAIIFLTEMTSNTATTQLALPILAAFAEAKRLDPIWLMLPATLAASCAFMLPVATPPNAIVFATGRLHIQEMIRSGLLLNLIGIVVISGMTLLLIPIFFG